MFIKCQLNEVEYAKNILQENLFEEIDQLKKQLEYIRSGEYYNQLRFERDMLQNLVDTGKISAEDKEFIDCTHRNTELLEENKQLKDNWNELKRIAKSQSDFKLKCKHGSLWFEVDELLNKMEELEKGNSYE